MKAVANLLGLGKTPTVSTAATDSTVEEQKKAKAARSALLSTEGGITGSELQPGQVGGRQTLFGN